MTGRTAPEPGRPRPGRLTPNARDVRPWSRRSDGEKLSWEST
jgi:hypothetical protein